MKQCFFVLVLALAGINPAHSQGYVEPSGQRFTTVKCKDNPGACLAEAAQICRGSYQVLNSNSHAGGLAADAIPGPVTWFAMTIRCGRSDGRVPDFPYVGPVYRPAPVYVPRDRYQDYDDRRYRNDREYRYRPYDYR